VSRSGSQTTSASPKLVPVCGRSSATTIRPPDITESVLTTIATLLWSCECARIYRRPSCMRRWRGAKNIELSQPIALVARHNPLTLHDSLSHLSSTLRVAAGHFHLRSHNLCIAIARSPKPAPPPAPARVVISHPGGLLTSSRATPSQYARRCAHQHAVNTVGTATYTLRSPSEGSTFTPRPRCSPKRRYGRTRLRPP
jgi:hypothetical protein